LIQGGRPKRWREVQGAVFLGQSHGANSTSDMQVIATQPCPIEMHVHERLVWYVKISSQISRLGENDAMA
jgi:hypothetical protein